MDIRAREEEANMYVWTHEETQTFMNLVPDRGRTSILDWKHQRNAAFPGPTPQKNASFVAAPRCKGLGVAFPV